MKAIVVPGRPDWIAVTLGNDERFLTIEEAEELAAKLADAAGLAREEIAARAGKRGERPMRVGGAAA